MPDFPDCPCSGGTLDKLIQPAILAVLSEGPSHGYRIAETIGEMPSFVGEKPDVSGIYRFLKNMESRGLVVSIWDAPGKGHAKRLYEIRRPVRHVWPGGLRPWIATSQPSMALLTAARTAFSHVPREDLLWAKTAQTPCRYEIATAVTESLLASRRRAFADSAVEKTDLR